jgi:hypothetical protein
VALSNGRVPVRPDRLCWPLDFKDIVRSRWRHTPSLNESFGDVGSRSKGPGEMERSSPGGCLRRVSGGDAVNGVGASVAFGDGEKDYEVRLG